MITFDTTKGDRSDGLSQRLGEEVAGLTFLEGNSNLGDAVRLDKSAGVA
ncbi:MAG TPA: hypothetical protein VFY84_12235 [Jiangellales bacterium]|nr:hypothetical protein [Jiangellales bacterium]